MGTTSADSTMAYAKFDVATVAITHKKWAYDVSVPLNAKVSYEVQSGDDVSRLIRCLITLSSTEQPE